MSLMRVLAVLLCAACGPSLVAPGGPARAAQQLCAGHEVTIAQGAGTVTGTEGPDVITAGPSATVYALGGDDLICTTGLAVVDGGAGADAIHGNPGAGGGTTAFLLEGPDTFVGSSADDTVVIVVAGVTVNLDTGGRDVVSVRHYAPGAARGTITFGIGSDSLEALGTGQVEVDAARGTLTVDEAGYALVHPERVRALTVAGHRVRVVGTSGNDDISATGCRVLAAGGRGGDTVRLIGNRFDLDLPPCRDPRTVLLGQRGEDRLTGRGQDDHLVGGRGRDLANGAGGRDTCLAEVERHCEQ